MWAVLPRTVGAKGVEFAPCCFRRALSAAAPARVLSPHRPHRRKLRQGSFASMSSGRLRAAWIIERLGRAGGGENETAQCEFLNIAHLIRAL
jgi:hypothetical protein